MSMFLVTFSKWYGLPGERYRTQSPYAHTEGQHYN